MESIEEEVEWHINNGSPYDLSDILEKLYELNTEKALDLTIKLAMSDFGGITHKMEYQNIAALATLNWNVLGIKKLTEATIKTGGFRALNNISRILSHISSKSLVSLVFANFNFRSVEKLELSSDKYKADDWVKTAKECLIKIAKSAEIDDKFPIALTQNMGFATNETASEHIFAALVTRWFNLDQNGIENYLQIVNASGHDEITYQNFLKRNPYILEPFHAQIWSKPKFGETLVPDFLIRSMDNSYTVVEIEKPDLPIMTKAGELSSYATHAKRQALDFRDWAIENNLYAVKRFPLIYRPYCLVIIGRESDLTDKQAQRLKQENESTQGILRIVGFDWLYLRAKATFDNIVNYAFDRSSMKYTLE